jgi:signal transduction histidine kinase
MALIRCGLPVHAHEVSVPVTSGSEKAAILQLHGPPVHFRGRDLKIAVAVAAMLLLALYPLARLRQIHRRYRRDLEVRSAERERIARDIHDTLLQGIQALLFRLQMWEEDRDIPEARRNEIAVVSQQTKSMVMEGRERILMMRRADAQPIELVRSLRSLGRAASGDEVPTFAVRVEGEPTPLTAEAEEQLLGIAREAVSNAYQHAGASHIAVALLYEKRSLAMIITDDGRGFDPTGSGWASQSKHFGLTGMRERARQIGAQFRVQSNSEVGTRIDVITAVRPVRYVYRRPLQRRSRPSAGSADPDSRGSVSI